MKWLAWIFAAFSLLFTMPASLASERGDPLAAMSEEQKDALAARIAAGVVAETFWNALRAAWPAAPGA